MERIEVEVALDARAILGEGPIWDTEQAVLVWVDIMGHRIHRFDPASGRDAAFDTGRPVGAVGLRKGGGVVVALEDGFGLVDPEWSGLELVAPVDADDPSIRFNDGACDPAGRFWAGTMAYDFTPEAAALYRLEPDHSVSRVLSGVTISNGIAWSEDARTMYYIDSPTQRVDAFDFDPESGAIENRRPVVEIPEEDGLPDGMTIDAEGCLWVALWGGWSVRRYRPDGTLDRVVEAPAAQVTACAFGGPDLEDLFITSAREGLGEEELAAQPHSGAVFRCRPGVAGRAPDRYER